MKIDYQIESVSAFLLGNNRIITKHREPGNTFRSLVHSQPNGTIISQQKLFGSIINKLSCTT